MVSSKEIFIFCKNYLQKIYKVSCVRLGLYRKDFIYSKILQVGALVVGVFGVTVFGQQQQQQQQQQFDRRDDQFERRNLQYDRREQQAVGRSPYYNPQDAVATITRFENDNNGDGTYQFAYETSNG